MPHPEQASSKSVTEIRNSNKTEERCSGRSNVKSNGTNFRPGLSVIKSKFHLSMKDAAESLGICQSTLQAACRQVGISRWPFRRSMQVARFRFQQAQPTNNNQMSGLGPRSLHEENVTKGEVSTATAEVAKLDGLVFFNGKPLDHARSYKCIQEREDIQRAQKRKKIIQNREAIVCEFLRVVDDVSPSSKFMESRQVRYMMSCGNIHAR